MQPILGYFTKHSALKILYYDFKKKYHYGISTVAYYLFCKNYARGSRGELVAVN